MKYLFLSVFSFLFVSQSFAQDYTYKDVYEAINTNHWDVVNGLIQEDPVIFSLVQAEKAGDFHFIATCAAHGKKDIIEKMIPYGFDINLQDDNGATPLHYAITSLNHDLVRMLLEYDANPNIKTRYGETALDMAKRSDNLEMVQIIDPSFQPRIEEVCFEDGKGGILMRTTLEGVVMAEGTIISMEDKRENGLWKYFYKTGELRETITFESGLMNGKNESYYPNGELFSKGQFKNDEADGTFTFYREDGSLERESTYAGAMPNGPSRKYHTNGKVASEGDFKNGKPDGEHSFYDVNGKKIETRVYKNGEMIKKK